MRALAIALLLADLACAPSSPASRTPTTGVPAAAGARPETPDAPLPQKERAQTNSERCLSEPISFNDRRVAPRALDGAERERIELASKIDDQGCLAPSEAGSSGAARSYPVPAPECKFSLGRTYFQAMHWREAALWFRKVVLDHPGDESAVYAMQLYLESLNVIATHAQPPRNVCLQAIADELPGFRCTFCLDKSKNVEPCEIIARIARELEQRGFTPGSGAHEYACPSWRPE